MRGNTPYQHSQSRSGVDLLSDLQEIFALKDQPDVLEDRADIPLGEAQLPKPLDVAELSTPVLDKHNSPCETKPPLEQACFMDDVHPCLHGAIRHLILCRHDHKGDCGRIQHL